MVLTSPLVKVVSDSSNRRQVGIFSLSIYSSLEISHSPAPTQRRRIISISEGRSVKEFVGMC